VIDYFQAVDLTVAVYADVLKAQKRKHAHSDETHYTPHDVASENIETGRSIADTVMESDLYFEAV